MRREAHVAAGNDRPSSHSDLLPEIHCIALCTIHTTTVPVFTPITTDCFLKTPYLMSIKNKKLTKYILMFDLSN